MNRRSCGKTLRSETTSNLLLGTLPTCLFITTQTPPGPSVEYRSRTHRTRNSFLLRNLHPWTPLFLERLFGHGRNLRKLPSPTLVVYHTLNRHMNSPSCPRSPTFCSDLNKNIQSHNSVVLRTRDVSQGINVCGVVTEGHRVTEVFTPTFGPSLSWRNVL